MLGYSLEAPRRGASNEYPQHMFLWRNKRTIFLLPPLIWEYRDCTNIIHLDTVRSSFGSLEV